MKKIYLKPVAECVKFYSEEAITSGGLENLGDITTNGELSINYLEIATISSDADWS